MHLNGPFDPSKLVNVGQPGVLNTTTTFHCPEAARIAGLIAEERASASEIPILPGSTPPAARAPSYRAQGSSPTAADYDFLLSVDVRALLAMRRLPLLRRGGWGTNEAWQALLRERIFPLLAAAPGSQQQKAGAHIWALLGVMLLAVEQRGAQLANAKLLQRIELLSVGDFRGLLGAFCANHAAQVAADKRKAALRARAPAAAAPDTTVERALRQVRCGELSIGMTTLRNEMAALRGAPALTASQALQFSPSFEISQSDRDVISAYIPSVRHVVDRKVLFEAVKGMRVTAAGGPNGITAGHLTEPVLEDEGCVNGLVTVVQSVLDGKIDPENISLLATSNLFALCERLRPDEQRPIACGDWLMRVVSRYVSLVLKEPLLQQLEPHQLGSSPCGTEVAYHAVRTFLETHPGKCLILADLSKAFQHLSRAKIFSHFMADPLLSPFVPFLRCLYLNDSDLLLDCGHELGIATLRSREGTQQGGPASSQIFNKVTLDPLLEIVAAVDESGQKLVDFLVAIVDDCSLFCDKESVPAVLTTLEREYAKVGCPFSRLKTKVLCLSDALPPIWSAPVENGGLGLKEGNIIDVCTPPDLRGARLLGGPIGHPDYEQAFLAGPKCFGSFLSDLNLVRENLGDNLQEALCLIKSCICTRATYLARLLDPVLLDSHLQHFDETALKTIVELLGCNFSDLLATGHKALEQAFVKPALGGLGLPPTHATANVAHVASVLDCIPLMRKLHPDLDAYYVNMLKTAINLDDGGPPLGDSGEAFITALLNLGPTAEATEQGTKIATKVFRKLLDLPVDEGAGADADGNARAAETEALEEERFGHRRLQYRLAQPVYTGLGAAYTASIAGDQLRTAQHLSQRTLDGAKGTGFLASGFLTTTPWQQRISTPDLRTALLLYAGLPDTFLTSGITCKCGTHQLAISSTAALQHISGCNKHGKTFAHDIFGRGPTGPFAAAITTMSSTALVAFEKPGYPTDGHKMDLLAYGVPGYTGALAIDYTLTNPTNESTLNNASLAPLYCAKEAHDDKIAKYQHLIPAGDVFVPFAVELYGGVHNTVVDFLQRCANSISQARGGVVEPKAVLGVLRQSFSIALMKARVQLYRQSIGDCIEAEPARRRQAARESFMYRAVQRAQRRAQVKKATTRPGARASEGRFGRSRF